MQTSIRVTEVSHYRPWQIANDKCSTDPMCSIQSSNSIWTSLGRPRLLSPLSRCQTVLIWKCPFHNSLHNENVCHHIFLYPKKLRDLSFRNVIWPKTAANFQLSPNNVCTPFLPIMLLFLFVFPKYFIALFIKVQSMILTSGLLILTWAERCALDSNVKNEISTSLGADILQLRARVKITRTLSDVLWLRQGRVIKPDLLNMMANVH